GGSGAAIRPAPPSRNPRSELHRLWEAPALDALPPGRFAHRNDGRDWRFRVRVANYLGKAEITSFRKLVHLGLLPSELERWHPLRADVRGIARGVAKTHLENSAGGWAGSPGRVGGLHPRRFAKASVDVGLRGGWVIHQASLERRRSVASWPLSQLPQFPFHSACHHRRSCRIPPHVREATSQAP